MLKKFKHLQTNDFRKKNKTLLHKWWWIPHFFQDNVIDSKVKFCICFFAAEGWILLVLFYPINLMVFYPLNENKSQLLASFESVAKQLLNIFGRFLSLSPWQFSSLLKKHVISLNYDPPILEYFWKNSTQPSPLLITTHTVYLYKLCMSEVKMIKTKTEGRPNF